MKKKEPRIYVMGKRYYEPTEQPRNKQGEWQKRSIMPYISGAAIILFGGFMLMNSGVKVEYEATPVAKADVIATSTPVQTETLEAKLNRVTHELVNQMVACENPHHILTWPDDNKEHSLPMKDKVSTGDLAFKISTVQRFYKTLHGTMLNDKEAFDLAADPVQARELALDAWINIKGSINEWSCVTDSMKAKVEIIRELEK